MFYALAGIWYQMQYNLTLHEKQGKKMRRKANITAESFRDKAVKCVAR